MTFRLATSFVAILAISIQANAASVSWAPAITNTAATDLIGGPVIQFVPAAYPGATSGTATFFTGGGGDTGNADLNTIYDSHGWNGAGTTITLGGLADGSDYQIQLLAAGDTRGCCATRTQVGDDGLGLIGSVSEDMPRGNSSVVGSFTAMGSMQDIMINGGTVDPVDPGLSGYILADANGGLVEAINFTTDVGNVTVTVPEPSSIGFALIAGLALLGFRKRR